MRVVFRKRICFLVDDVYLRRIMELPFCPPLGMLVIDGDWECVVTELVWDEDKKYVEAWAEADVTTRWEASATSTTAWIDRGWEQDE